jgi:hypothetical protein
MGKDPIDNRAAVTSVGTIWHAGRGSSHSSDSPFARGNRGWFFRDENTGCGRVLAQTEWKVGRAPCAGCSMKKTTRISIPRPCPEPLPGDGSDFIVDVTKEETVHMKSAVYLI